MEDLDVRAVYRLVRDAIDELRPQSALIQSTLVTECLERVTDIKWKEDEERKLEWFTWLDGMMLRCVQDTHGIVTVLPIPTRHEKRREMMARHLAAAQKGKAEPFDLEYAVQRCLLTYEILNIRYGISEVWKFHYAGEDWFYTRYFKYPEHNVLQSSK